MRNVLLYLFILLNTVFPVKGGANYLEKVEAALAAVVTVTVEKERPLGKVLLGFRGEASAEAYRRSLELVDALGSGSGFVVTHNNKKYIITNAHVVENAAEEQGSLFIYSISRKKYAVKLLGGDSFYDVAVLEFVDPPGNEINSLQFAFSTPRVTERVFAIGNPLGEYPYTITDGIVSALNRTRGGVTGKFGYIQTTATMIWGNSGGPLVNDQGEVVGINSQIEFTHGPGGEMLLQQQLNFSLDPVIAKRVVEEIITQKKVKRAYLGIEISQGYNIQQGKAGVFIGGKIDELPVISDVLPGPAFHALSSRKGYHLTHINNNEVRNLEEVLEEFEKVKPGSKVVLKIKKLNESLDITISPVELNPSHLEALGKYMLDKNKDMVVEEVSAQLQIRMPGNSSALTGYNKYQKEYIAPSKQFDSYYLVAAGITTSDARNLWRITTLADLGAVLRIYGIRGTIEYLLVSSSDKWKDTFKWRQRFSENENIFRSVVWY